MYSVHNVTMDVEYLPRMLCLSPGPDTLIQQDQHIRKVIQVSLCILYLNKRKSIKN